MSLMRTKPVAPPTDTGLKRCLTAWDLTLLGVGAIIGAGIFVLTGRSAATEAGPAIVLSFCIAGVACACAALAYAELAAAIGGAGSAYSYGYAGFGELPGWTIGWMLVAEYAIAVATVAVGWSGYFNDGLIALGKLTGLSLAFPPWLLHGPFEKEPGLINLPAAGLLVGLGVLLATGAKASARFNAAMVIIKLAAIAVFIFVAIRHIDPQNWVPFIPPLETHGAATSGITMEMKLLDAVRSILGFEVSESHFGVAGVFAGAALVFFAYIGFDAVSTSAEETRNPQRDLPIGIIGSLVLCTILYIIVSGLLTAVVPYHELNTPAPVSHALLQLGESSAAGLISIGAIAGLTTVCLVMYYGLTRLLFAISRDGLLPIGLSKINATTGSPMRIIVVVGAWMVAMAGFLPLNRLAELTNISTLAAFVVVCGGVIALRRTNPQMARPFRVPFSPVVPMVGMLASAVLMIVLPVATWVAFLIWMAIGLFIYFTYSRNHSLLAASASK